MKGMGTNFVGTGQALAFLAVAILIGALSLLLGGLFVGYFAFLLFGLLFVLFFAGENRELAWTFYLFLAVGFLAGGLAHDVLSSAETAVQVGDWPLIGALLESQPVQVGLAILAGLLSGMLAVGLVLGTGGDTIVVDEGEIKKTNSGGPLNKFGVPSNVVVEPYNAVVLVREGKISRIEGPGMVKLKRGEEIKDTVDLRPQSGGYEVEVWTKDNVPLTVRGGISFRIESRDEAQARGDEGDSETNGLAGAIGGSYPVYRHTLHRAVYAVGADKNWKGKTRDAPKSKVRAVVRDCDLEEIFPLDEAGKGESFSKALAKKVTEAVQKDAQKWGVTVHGVGVNEIEMPEELREYRRAAWKKRIEKIQAEGDQEAELIRAEGVHKAIRSLEEMKVVALEGFRKQILAAIDGDSIKDPKVAVELITALERLTRNMVTDNQAAVQLTELLERLVPLSVTASSSLSGRRGYLGQGEGSKHE